MRPTASAALRAVAALVVALALLGPGEAPAIGRGHGTFRPTGSCSQGVCPSGGAVLLASGKVLLASKRQFSPHPETELYDPATGTFSPTGRCEACGYAGASLTLLPFGPPSVCGPQCGKALLAGGITQDRAGQESSTDAVFLFDPIAVDPATGQPGVWSQAAPMTRRRAFHTATVLPDGKVLVSGGCSQACQETGRDDPTTATELYDPAAGTWSPGPEMGMARYRHTATAVAKGQVLVVGGSPGGQQGAAGLDSAELYEPAKRAWVPTGSLGGPRQRHSATRLRNGDVLVIGGANGNVDINSAEIYDAPKGSWRPTGILALARVKHAATLLADGTVLVVGGRKEARNRAELYDPSTGSWTDLGTTTQPLGNPTATLLATRPRSVCKDLCGAVLIAGDAPEAELYVPPPPAAAPPSAPGNKGGRTKWVVLATAGSVAVLAAGIAAASRRRRSRR